MRLIAWPGPVSALLYGVGICAVAGLTHGTSVLMAAHRQDSAAFEAVAARTPVNAVTKAADAPPNLPFQDPSMARAFCRYDLASGPLRLTVAPFSTGFVAIGIHGRRGEPFFGLSVDAGEKATIAVVVLTADQQKQIADAEEDGEEPSHDLQVVSPGSQGFVMIETPAGGSSPSPQAEDALAHVSCGPEPTKTAPADD